MRNLDPLTALGADSQAFIGGAAEVAAAVALALVAVAVIVAAVEIVLRMSHDRHEDSPAPVLSALAAQRLYRRVLYGVAPTLVAAGITWQRTEDLSGAAFVLVAVGLTTAVLRAHRHPLHLAPIARYAYNAFVPAAGVVVAVSPGIFGQSPVPFRTAAAAGIGAALTTVMASFFESRFESDRPIWLAVVGSPDFAEKLASELEFTGIRSHRVIGYIGDAPLGDGGRVRWLGELNDVRAAVLGEGIDLLVVAPHNARMKVFEQAARDCLDLPVRMIEATALYEDVLGHVPIGTINSAWFQFIMHPRYSPSSPLSKRSLDIIVSGLMLAVAGPFLLLAALAVKLEDRGPIFYRQRRVGEEGVEFDMLKFRTLRADADDLWETHSEAEMITRVGRVLRKTHFNELPQLAQVLRGQMSLVGPRPEPPALVEQLSGLVPFYERRGLVKPGLTGWAQVRCGYAGSHQGTAWKMCHDLYYIKHRSARFDLMILVQTLHALIEREEGQEQLPARDFILGDAVEVAGH